MILIADQCFSDGLDIVDSKELQDSILLLQIANLTTFDKNVQTIAEKHAIKIAHNHSSWTEMDKFYLRAALE